MLAELRVRREQLRCLIDACSTTIEAGRSASGDRAPGPRLFTRDVVRLGEAEILLARQEVRHARGTQRLTPTEWQLLTFLIAHPVEVHSRVKLAIGAWGAGFAERNSEVEVYVSRLRRKLGPAGVLLETVRGQGYRLMLVPRPAVVAPPDPLSGTIAVDTASAAAGG